MTVSTSSSIEGRRPPNCNNSGSLLLAIESHILVHGHGWQTVYKTMASNTTLAECAFRYSAFAVAQPIFTPDDIYISQIAGLHEAVAAGVTTILDHAHPTWTPDHSAAGVTASINSGARVLFGYNFQDSSAEFGVPEQIAQWNDLAASTPGSLTELVVACDY